MSLCNSVCLPFDHRMQGTCIYTGRFLKGGVHEMVEAPYERMPLYVRAGSIVPMGSQIRWSDERPADVIDLYVYAGADGAFTLYEDENINYNYEKGFYSMIGFRYEDESASLKIGERQGEFPGMLKQRVFNIIKVTPEGTAKPVKVVYEGKEMNITLN